MDLASVFFEYCKKGSAVGGAGKNAADGYTMTQREWVSMCKDAKVPVSIGEINDAHRRVDRPTKEEKEELMKKKGTGMGGGSNSGGSVSVLRCLLAPLGASCCLPPSPPVAHSSHTHVPRVAAAKADKELKLSEFLEAIIRLAVKLLSASASGRKALKAGNGAEGVKRLLDK